MNVQQPLISRRRACRVVAGVWALASASLASPTTHARDIELPALASAALALEHEMAQRPDAGSDVAAFNVYLRTLPNGLRLHSIHARWGDASSEAVEINHQTAEALRAGGVIAVPLPLTGTAPQPLVVELVASRMVSGARIARLRLTYSGDVDATAGPGFIELVLDQQGLRKRHTLAVAETPTSEPQLKVGVAELLLDTGHPYRAAALLQTLQGTGADVAPILLRARQALHIGAGPHAASDAPVSARYAQARQLLREGQRDAAINALRAVAESTDTAPAARVLRDRAHLALAEQALYDGRADEASVHFQQVHSPGPFASRALLGLGWSSLFTGTVPRVADGTGKQAAAPRLEATGTLRPGNANEAAELRRLSPFRYAEAITTGARQEKLNAALGVWQELIGRDPADPAVQEGMLAMAYAFGHLGAHEQAQQRYLRAIKQMLMLRGHLADARRHVDSGALLEALRANDADAPSGWSWWLLERRDARWWMDDGIDAAPLFYVEHLIEDDAFRTALSDDQSLQAIAARLTRWAANPPPGLAARIDALRAQAEQALARQATLIETLARQNLAQRLATTDTYVAEAHLALARLYDRPDGAPSLYSALESP